MRVFVHIGHGKTGSSYLQTCLALNRDKLRHHGIQYPIDAGRAEKAKAGHVTIGSFDPFYKNQTLKDFLYQASRSAKEDILISGEQIASPSAFEQLAGLGSVEEVESVIVLLFIRNPLDHVVSFYQQYVRGHGEAGPLDKYMQSYSYPNHVSKVINLCMTHGYDVRIRNYSTHKNTIWSEFLRMMDLDPEHFDVPEMPTVHRGLTKIELETARILNEKGMTTQAKEMSSYLSQTYPARIPEKPHVDPAALRRFLERMRTLTEKVNDMVPVAEQYEVPSFEEVEAHYCTYRKFSETDLRSELAPIIEFFGTQNDWHRSESAVWQMDSCLTSAQQKLKAGDQETARRFLASARKAYRKITMSVNGVDRVAKQLDAMQARLSQEEKS